MRERIRKTLRKLLRVVADHDPAYYDMYADRNETLFAQLYLLRILRHAEAAGIRPPARVLDAGCQAGRLAIPLAARGFAVTGVDTSEFALRRARRHAKAAGARARWMRGDMARVLAGRAQSFDLAVCAEVLYLSPRYRGTLATLARAVRPGGLVCVSHRPLLYYLYEALRRQDMPGALSVLQRREGACGGAAYVNWQTEDELRALYDEVGLAWVAHYPIDRVAWLTGMDVSKLSGAEQDAWLELELGLEAGEGMCARYALVVAARPADGGEREGRG